MNLSNRVEFPFVPQASKGFVSSNRGFLFSTLVVTYVFLHVFNNLNKLIHISIKHIVSRLKVPNQRG